MKGLFVIPATMLIAIVHVIYFGWAISILWGWFVSPISGLRIISIPEAIGFVLVIKIFNMKYSEADPTDLKENWKKIIFAFLAPAYILLAGYIVLQFI